MSEATPPVRDEYRTTATTNMCVFPLTYDEDDSTGAVTLTRLGAGPHITPEGFRANGYDSRYSAPVASVGAGASASLRATIRLEGEARNATRDMLVSLTHATLDQPKLELAAKTDPSDAAQPCIALRQYTGSVVTTHLNRPGWRFEFRAPELVGGLLPSFQSLVWLSADDLLVCCHVNDAQSVLYRLDMSTGEYTGRASSTTYRHIGSLAVDANGDVWATDNYSGGAGYSVFKLDLTTSFSTGDITAVATCAQSGMNANGGLAFATIGGLDYVLLQEYSTLGTPYLYAFLASDLVSSPLVAGARVGRYSLGLRIQDHCVRVSNGLLYSSRNVKQSGGSATGVIQAYDVAAALAGADGATLTPVATYAHASQYSEGIDFHPSDDRVWVCTEGLTSVSDQRSHVAVWSRDLAGSAEENSYLIDYDGASRLLEVRLNGRLMVSATVTAPTVNPTKLSIGAPPGAAAGWAVGFMTAGTIHTVAVKDSLFTLTELADLDAGSYEPNTLVTNVLTLTNPGAESGTAGWTSELGGTFTTRSANPAPLSGAAYFAGTGGANVRARQRLAIPSGLTSPWARIDWLQAAYDASDPGACGIRALDASSAQLALVSAGALSVTPVQAWRPRALAVDLPAGTTQVDALYVATWTAGTNVDLYVDDVRVTIYSKQP